MMHRTYQLFNENIKTEPLKDETLCTCTYCKKKKKLET